MLIPGIVAVFILALLAPGFRVRKLNLQIIHFQGREYVDARVEVAFRVFVLQDCLYQLSYLHIVCVLGELVGVEVGLKWHLFVDLEFAPDLFVCLVEQSRVFFDLSDDEAIKNYVESCNLFLLFLAGA